MKFQNTFVSREHWYTPGVEVEPGSRFAAIPLANRMVDYIEPYKISDAEYGSYLENPDDAREFIESCRRREQDDRLFLQRGSDRGTPV